MGSIANELITRGWTKGILESSDGRVCLVGAALCAFGLAPEFQSLMHIPEALSDALIQVTNRELQMWNDAPDRTYDEVLRAAKEADEILDGSP